MTAPQQAKQDRCVLTRHDVQSIKDLVFVVGGNSESSAQKAIFEILGNNMRRSRPLSTAPNFVKDCMCNKYTNCTDCQQHDTAIRKAEREKVFSFLDELISDRVSDARKREIVESLRTQQEQP